MTDFTPGPWEVNPHKETLISGVRNGEHANIAEAIVIPAHGPERYAIAAANARFIAGSPELLQALKDVMMYSVTNVSACDWAWQAGEDAIAKAEGKL